MSMIEKFLGLKDGLRKDLNEIKDELMKATEKAVDDRIDGFVDEVKAMVAGATNDEFIEFITSGKLEDEDIHAAIVFRAEVMNGKAKVSNEPSGCENVKSKHNVRVLVIQ